MPQTGYFSDDSMLRRVMRKRAVGLTYGTRALVIGAVHPLLYVGTAENSQHRSTPYTRLALTGRLFEAVFLGTREEADRALAFTRRKHATVSGALPEDAGRAYPAGTRYSALDPNLMFMTMAFTFDSVEATHDLLVGRLTATERADLYQDFVRWAELFGMPRAAAPADHRSFRAEFDVYLASDLPHLTAEARLVGEYLSGQRVAHRLPLPTRGLTSGMALLIQGSLPPRVRELYRMPWDITDELAFRSLVAAVRAAHVTPPLLPRPLQPFLAGPSSALYRRLAVGEKRLVAAGKESMPGVDPRNYRERHAG
ncbi:oxygenase MpaB family protein [Nocardia stercoris]|uniref:DUF2236 domain-containing protein n=1 Tax=Nocardia stercoris TaxID=2483361 RepID=A0A3M2L2A6_9NOCA|nr:oxygenase MpaB family protein [Nocardia stercoris]RMI31767.1 DUF2236 domain-containing protein [Nocardia stercoris]